MIRVPRSFGPSTKKTMQKNKNPARNHYSAKSDKQNPAKSSSMSRCDSDSPKRNVKMFGPQLRSEQARKITMTIMGFVLDYSVGHWDKSIEWLSA